MKHNRIKRTIEALSALALTGTVSSLTIAQTQSVIQPASEQAQDITYLWWAMFWVACVIFFAVITLLTIGLLQGSKASRRSLSHTGSRNLVVIAGVLIPLLTIICLVGGSLFLGKSLSASPPENALKVRITGWMWWWEIEYLDSELEVMATTANELHVPVGQPVHLYLESGDVIHSFWVPQLHGKTDMVPGRTNHSWFTVNKAGSFRGQCAEFCGLQHALMGFLVVAQPASEFQRWLDVQSLSAKVPATESTQRGKQAFFASQCDQCHTVRGTNADGTQGPDLTHIASRQSLAAMTRANNRGHLGGWIANPEGIKPGAKMPGAKLNSQVFSDLLDYLQSLE